MFEPSNRTAFLRHLRPPSGFRLERALGTTYTLDLDALAAALGSMAGVNDTVVGGTDVFLSALMNVRSRLRLYCHPGKIASPRGQAGSLKLLDEVIRSPILKRGRFHPKLWLLRFNSERRGEVPKYRLIVSSRNLTASTIFFESALVLEGSPQPHTGLNKNLLRFLRTLSPSERHRWSDLDRVEFRPPPRINSIGLHFQWGANRNKLSSAILTRHYTRAVIVSPFVDAGFLRTFKCDDLTLISNRTALDALGGTQPNIKRFVIGDVPGEDGSRFFEGLHAKILATESPLGPEICLGSANATTAAWGGANTEAAAILSGPGASLKSFQNDFIFVKGTTLHPWIQSYEPPDDARVSAEARAKIQFERDSDEIVQALLAKSWELTSTDKTAAVLRPAAAKKPKNSVDVTKLSCGLLGGPHRPIGDWPTRRLIELALPNGAEGLTDLIELRFTCISRITSRRVRFKIVFKAQATFDRAARDRSVLRGLTSDNARFYSLMTGLFEPHHSAASGKHRDRRKKRSSSTEVDGLLESILQGLSAAPERWGDLKRIAESRENPDPDFQELWRTLLSIFERTPSRRVAG